MECIQGQDARAKLVKYLGYDQAEVEALAALAPASGGPGGGAAGKGPTKETEMTEETEDVVKRALLVGDFKSAVRVCFENGHVGDALVLSSCGGAELWKETQKNYFEREGRPYLRIVEAVLGGDLEGLIGNGTFEETMAVFSTYGKSEEFPRLCEKLGEHLKAQNDPAAILCYLCALNVPSAVAFWKAEYEASQVRSARLSRGRFLSSLKTPPPNVLPRATAVRSLPLTQPPIRRPLLPRRSRRPTLSPCTSS